MFAEQPEHHEMILESVHDSGAEEWYCPTCGRRFLMQWPPDYRKIVLEAGDENAIHSGGKNQAEESPENSPEKQPEEQKETQGEGIVAPDDPTLEPYRAWMEKIDFETLWNHPSE